jgi:glucose/arabinose dehydrogenase
MTPRRRCLSLSVIAALAVAACGSSDAGNTAGPPSSVVAVAPVTTSASVEPIDTPVPVTTVAADSTNGPASSAEGVAPPLPPPPTTLAADLDAVAVALTEIGEFAEPLAMTTRPGDDVTMYIGERAGVVRAINDEDNVELLDITDNTKGDGEQGLLGLAISLDGRFMYVSSTRNDGTSAIDEYPFSEDGSLNADARRVVIETPQPFGNHNGGHLAFGPDGMLYVGMGDGGAADDPDRRAQDTNDLLGKMLRINPSTPSGELGYTVPADNPFVGVDGYRPEIWSLGLRNPWRYSFDRATGDLWIGDVGQNEWEEVDVATAASGTGRGVSFGWSAFEGNHRFNDDQSEEGHQSPIHEYSHSSGDGNSISGGFVYRGAAIPALYGAYVFGDYETGNIWAITADAAGALTNGPVKIAEQKALASFGEDAAGELYVLSLNGSIARLDAG